LDEGATYEDHRKGKQPFPQNQKKKRWKKKKGNYAGRQMTRPIADGWWRLQDKSSVNRFLIDSRVRRSWVLKRRLLRFTSLYPDWSPMRTVTYFYLLVPGLDEFISNLMCVCVCVCVCAYMWFMAEALGCPFIIREEFTDRMTSGRYNAAIRSLAFHRPYCSDSSRLTFVPMDPTFGKHAISQQHAMCASKSPASRFISGSSNIYDGIWNPVAGGHTKHPLSFSFSLSLSLSLSTPPPSGVITLSGNVWINYTDPIVLLVDWSALKCGAQWEASPVAIGTALQSNHITRPPLQRD